MPGYFNLIGGAQQRKKERKKIYSDTAVDLTSGPSLRVLVNKGVFEKKGFWLSETFRLILNKNKNKK